MSGPVDDERLRTLTRLARAQPSLRLLLLFGSRARGEEHAGSDWDLGYQADPSFDPDGFLAEVVLALESNHVDLVDLDRASGLLRFRAAREGQLLHEGKSEAYEEFCVSAARFWFDAGPTLEREYASLLEDVAS